MSATLVAEGHLGKDYFGNFSFFKNQAQQNGKTLVRRVIEIDFRIRQRFKEYTLGKRTTLLSDKAVWLSTA